MEGMQEESGFMELLESGDLLGLGRDDGLGREEENDGLLLFDPPPTSTCSSSSPSGARMLCFGRGRGSGGGGVVAAAQKSSDSSLSTLSSSPSSTTTTSSKPSSRKVEAGGGRRSPSTGSGSAATAAVSAGKKKLRTEPSLGQSGTIRVRKEKLGERITALQQLVSPFGKSDTASVLHEALGYIRFLHEQVQVLSSPYLQHLPPSSHLHEGRGVASSSGGAGGDLRSRGLCLVPVACTERVANSNGADLWSPSSKGMSKSLSSPRT